MLSWLTLAVLIAAAPERYPNADLLILPADLSHLGADQVRILDARPHDEYRAGHIPGAVWVDLAGWSKAVNEPHDAKLWATRLASVGVEPTKPIVVYAADVRDAARVWWILKYMGVSDARLLDGGWTLWRSQALPIEERENQPAVNAADWKPQRERLATKEDVLARLKDKSAGILDARSFREFCGQMKLAERAGAIPGALHLEWTELLDPKTKQFKPVAELRQLFKERQIDPDKPAVTYCQSGGRAAVLAFGLELMGGKQVSNYYKSWSEWGNDKDTPIESGTKKK